MVRGWLMRVSHSVRVTVLVSIVLLCGIHLGAQPKPDPIRIVDRPILFNAERVRLTLEYRRQHQDPHATDITIHPQVIVLHHTAIDSFESTWKYFNNVRSEAAR